MLRGGRGQGITGPRWGDPTARQGPSRGGARAWPPPGEPQCSGFRALFWSDSLREPLPQTPREPVPSAHACDILEHGSSPRPTHQCCPFLCRRWSSSRSLGPGWQTGSWGKTRVECAGALGRGHQVRQCSGKVGAAAPMWQTLSAAVSRLALEPGELREQGGGAEVAHSHFLDQLLLIQCSREVPLVTQH